MNLRHEVVAVCALVEQRVAPAGISGWASLPELQHVV
jgi:hypothetical protein